MGAGWRFARLAEGNAGCVVPGVPLADAPHLLPVVRGGTPPAPTFFGKISAGSGRCRWRRRTPKAAAGDGTEPDGTDRRPADGTEPDPRFTFANERTFLAWSRTALALVVAGLGVVQLLPPFPGCPGAGTCSACPLIVFGAVVAVTAYGDWGRSQRALRRGQPLPRSVMPRLLAAVITTIAAIAAVVVLVSALR